MKRRRYVIVLDLRHDCEECGTHPRARTLFLRRAVHLQPKAERRIVGFRAQT